MIRSELLTNLVSIFVVSRFGRHKAIAVIGLVIIVHRHGCYCSLAAIFIIGLGIIFPLSRRANEEMSRFKRTVSHCWNR